MPVWTGQVSSFNSHLRFLAPMSNSLGLELLKPRHSRPAHGPPPGNSSKPPADESNVTPNEPSGVACDSWQGPTQCLTVMVLDPHL